MCSDMRICMGDTEISRSQLSTLACNVHVCWHVHLVKILRSLDFALRKYTCSHRHASRPLVCHIREEDIGTNNDVPSCNNNDNNDNDNTDNNANDGNSKW